MATYPSGVFAPASRSAGQTIQPSHINDLQAEVTAIEDALKNGISHAVTVASTVTATHITITPSTGSFNVAGPSSLATLQVNGLSTFAGAVTFAGGQTFGGLLVASTGLTVSTGVVTLGQGQIVFPATQVPSSDANTLDDYDEGAAPWTPALTGTGGGSGQTYTTQVGWAIKIGKMVFFGGRLTMSALGTVTTQAVITGLPFPAENTANMKGTVHIGNWQNMGSALSYVSGVIEPNTSQIALWGTNESASLSALTQSNLANTTDLTFSGSYRAAA